MITLAVIGLDAQFANGGAIDCFDRAVYQGNQQTSDNRCNHNFDYQAAAIASVQKLAEANSVDAAQVTVLLVCEASQAELQTQLDQQFAACIRCENINQAMQQIQAGDAEGLFAIVGSHQQQGEVASEQYSLSFAEDFAGYSATDGLASLLLCSEASAVERASYVYGYIKGFCDQQDIATSSLLALNQSGFTVDDIRYLETSALADQSDSDAEMQGLIQAYNTDSRLQTAVGSVRSVVGDSDGFTQVAGLLKTVICLHQRYYPGTQDWQKPRSDSWLQSPFYFPVESSPIYPNANGKPLAAAFSCATAEGYGHWIVQENPAEQHRSNGYMACSNLVLIPLAAESETALLARLDRLAVDASEAEQLQQLARDYYQAFKGDMSASRLCLLAESFAELDKEIALAREGIKKAFAEQQEWKTPKGSFFSPQIMPDEHGVTFLYPGIGASYIGLGREIFHLFPEIYQPVADLADDIGSSLKDSILYPRSVDKPSFKELKAMDHEFRNHLPSIAECGVGYACVFTKIFEEVFKLQADFAAGYSMGEISMYAALGCWKRPGEMSERLANSDTFNHRLTGDLLTLREHWGLPASNGDEKLWETYTLKATPEEVAEACEDEDRVYCTIINTPDSLVIGGYPPACERVLKKLGVRGMSLDIQNAIHSPPAFIEYQNMERLYTMEVNDRLPTKIFSSSCYLPVPQRTKAIANSIAKCLCDPVDFPRLISTLYDKGARVFIEMGPGRSLCSWADKIFKHNGEQHPHLSVPVNAKGTSDELTIMRAIARLVSHGVAVDMDRLYYGSLITNNNA